MPAVFNTNPVSQALHYSPQREEGDILIVGGEMSDTMIYQVSNSTLFGSDVDNWKPFRFEIEGRAFNTKLVADS